MRKLYVILSSLVELDGLVALVEEVEVVKETDKQLILKHPKIYRTTLNKSSLDYVLNGSMLFTYDLNKGTKIWNDHFSTEAESLRDRARKCDDLII